MDVDALSTQQEAFLAVVTRAGGAGLDAVVTACAPWTVRDVVLHLASVHRWAADAVVAAPDAALPPRTDPREPRTREALLAEYAAAAALLRGRLAGAAPDAPCLGLVGPADAAFWARRQAAETAVHRWDVLDALSPGPETGADAGPDPDAGPEARTGARPRVGAPADAVEVAADVVAEVVEVMHPRQVHLGRTGPLEAGIGLVATDAGRRWTLGPAPEVAVVTGPAAVLARLVWRRTTPDHPELVVTGDAAALAAVLATPVTP